MRHRACPLNYEPSGSDFLSPCLQEVDLMVKVVEAEDNQFNDWVRKFLPQLFEEDFELEPGQASGCWIMINRTIHTMITHRLLTALTENWFTWTASTSPGPGASTTSPGGWPAWTRALRRWRPGSSGPGTPTLGESPTALS
mgnify:CR=1 FL=1